MSLGASDLGERDALLSRLIGEVWPFSLLLAELGVPLDASVLDLGGGDGGLLSELARRGHTGRRERIDRLHGSDAHALPFPDGSFDRVFMLRVLGHLHTPALALAEAWRVLAPGGTLVVAAHGPEHLAGVLTPGRAAEFSFTLPGMRLRSLEVSRPIHLSVADLRVLAGSYDLPLTSVGPIASRVQLSGWVLSRAEDTQEGRG